MCGVYERTWSLVCCRYFGERESDFAVAGFVPSIKREGKITPFDPPSVHETKPFRTKEQRKAHRRRGLLKNKQAPIPQRVNHEVALRKAIRVGSDTEHVLNETERNIKFGLFVITLMFFQVCCCQAYSMFQASNQARRIFIIFCLRVLFCAVIFNVEARAKHLGRCVRSPKGK